jgi:hypothetical protein
MNLQIENKDLFVRQFLQPISKISDSCCIIIENNVASCIVSSPDNSVILSNRFNLSSDIESKQILNIPDIKKLIRAFDVIEGESISLQIDKNNISYKNKNTSFKYHLLENGVVNIPKINTAKINSIAIDCEFILTDNALSEIVKASTFCVDSNKIYLYTENNSVFAEITDRARPNVDSFGIKVAEEYKGKDLKSLCLSMEVLRIISTNRVKQMQTKINVDLGVVLFEFTNNSIYTQFIVSSLTK